MLRFWVGCVRDCVTGAARAQQCAGCDAHVVGVGTMGGAELLQGRVARCGASGGAWDWARAVENNFVVVAGAPPMTWRVAVAGGGHGGEGKGDGEDGGELVGGGEHAWRGLWGTC